MLTLVPSFVALVEPLGWTMQARSFRSFLTLLTGWIFATRRTITGMLLAAGVAGRRHHAAYHRFFSAARWSLDELGLLLFHLITPWLAPGPVQLTLDDTLARKRGLKVFGAGMHHDPHLSTRKLAVLRWGHSWVVLAVVVKLPFCPQRVFSLPLLFRLYLNQKASSRWRRTYRKRTELAVELLQRLCRAHPERSFHALADSAYGGETVLGHLPCNCGLTSRMPLNARLHQPPPVRKPGTNGRPRVRGMRLPTPQQALQQRGRRCELAIYGRHDRVRLVELVAHWYGVPARPLKVVVVEPLVGGRPVQVFYSTRTEQAAEQVLVDYSRRWSIEEAFQGSKSHLGFEQPQGWSRHAALRTAPMALLLYSLVVLWFARAGHALCRPLVRPWYRTKRQPSFADMLMTLRRESLRAWVSAHPAASTLPQNFLRSLIDMPAFAG
ncbi:IS701 family transposase [Sorangium sp. So ce145]|uniref:IS701 family transposase n=1 Tax=Sorangium sp. So ce145 TaxID=3133285 RepID=UPI003F62F11D